MASMYQVAKPEFKMNILVYGIPGVGKTVFAASAQDCPHMKDVLVLNIEGGLLSVADRGDITAVDIRSMEELEEQFWNLANRKEGYERFQTVVIDSGSELQTLNLEQIARQSLNKPESKRQGKTMDDLWIEDYGKSTANLRRIFRWFRDLPLHVIITALPKTIYSGTRGQGEPTAVVPSLTDKLGESLMGYVDAVWYMYMDSEENRKILTQSKGIHRAKTRGIAFSKSLGLVLEDPDMNKIHELFLEGGK